MNLQILVFLNHLLLVVINMIQYYTGIGSRETPNHTLILMTKIAKYLDSLGFILRSGGASGADTAFANGAVNKQIFIPWKNFNGIKDGIYLWDEQTKNQAFNDVFNCLGENHWNRLSNGGKELHLRNWRQIFGVNLNDKFSNFVICYTQNGIPKGGTRTAILLALKNKIPVYNLGNNETYYKINTFMSTLKNENYNIK